MNHGSECVKLKRAYTPGQLMCDRYALFIVLSHVPNNSAVRILTLGHDGKTRVEHWDVDTLDGFEPKLLLRA